MVAGACRRVRPVLASREGLALCQMMVARLLGDEDPLGREAGEAARRFFVESGDVNLVEVFSEALPAGEVREAAAG